MSGRLNPRQPDGELIMSSGEAWFCLRAKPKHEHIAAVHLRQHFDLQVLLPRIRYKRLTRQGSSWTTEALFPGYLFAEFDLGLLLRRVRHARGIQDIVHFGNRWPTIPESVIADLKLLIGTDEVHVIPDTVSPGDSVEIAGGAFHGMQAIVSRVLPGRQRVTILLDFLGRQTSIELEAHRLVPKQ